MLLFLPFLILSFALFHSLLARSLALALFILLLLFSLPSSLSLSFLPFNHPIPSHPLAVYPSFLKLTHLVS